MICFRGCFTVRVPTCLFIFTLCGRIIGALNEPVKVTVMEEDDAILPCSLSTKENIESKLFDWKKDGQKEVFMYDAGSHYNNGRSGQDEQFKGRVSHFRDELKRGNASIIIRNTEVADSGNYTCVFPRLQPSQTFHTKLVVDGIFKDRRVENVPGSVSEPSVTIIDQTKDGMKLQCEVRGVSPKPEVEWKDSSGNIVPAKKTEIPERGGSYDIILEAPVTKTDRYRCVVTQKEIYHQVYAEVYLHFTEKPEKCSQEEASNKMDIGVVIGLIVGVILTLSGVEFRKRSKRGDRKDKKEEKTPKSETSQDQPESVRLRN